MPILFRSAAPNSPLALRAASQDSDVTILQLTPLSSHDRPLVNERKHVAGIEAAWARRVHRHAVPAEGVAARDEQARRRFLGAELAKHQRQRRTGRHFFLFLWYVFFGNFHFFGFPTFVHSDSHVRCFDRQHSDWAMRRDAHCRWHRPNRCLTKRVHFNDHTECHLVNIPAKQVRIFDSDDWHFFACFKRKEKKENRVAKCTT